jgi:hypothetical protein
VEDLLKNDPFLKYKSQVGKGSKNATIENSRQNSRERSGMSNFTIPIESLNTQTLTGRRKLIRDLHEHRRKYEQTIDASASKYSKFFINEISK